MGWVQVQATEASAAAADALVAELLDARLVACGQRLGPIVSRYRWQGRVETAEEWLVLVKTTDARVDEVVARAVAHSAEEVPEVLVTEVIGGHAPYLAWVAAEVAP